MATTRVGHGTEDGELVGDAGVMGQKLRESQAGRAGGAGSKRSSIFGRRVWLGVVGVQWLQPPRSQTTITAVRSDEGANAD